MPTAIKLYYQMNGATAFLVIYRIGILHNDNGNNAMSTAATLPFAY